MAAVTDLVVALAVTKDGRLLIQNRRAFDEAVSRLNPEWQLEVTVKRQRATRSTLQNRYYWGVVIDALVRHCDHNYTPDEMHEICKAKFIPKTLAVCDGNGEVVCEYVFGGSTRRLNTEQFGDYMETIRQWAAESLDLIIPDPDENYEPVVSHTKVDTASRPTWYRAKRRSA